MPIPTDTFWNIRKLNVVFALSSVALFAVTAWAIFQDHDKDWRIPQREARVWDAALVDDKIHRELTPQEKQKLSDLQQQIGKMEQELVDRNKGYQDLAAHRKALESDKATLEFRQNNLKSTVQVMETELQDAIAEGDQQRVTEMQSRLEGPRKQLAGWTEQLASLGDQITEVRKQMDAETAKLDALKKQHRQMAGDIDTLQKQLDSLAPKSFFAKLSDTIRDMPLMGFINPSEKIQQIVLPDVRTALGTFKQVETIDRCMTCHVNIAKKEYTPEKITAYLEEQSATVRQMRFPTEPGTNAAQPNATETAPGAVALPEFWHGWAQKLAPANIGKQAGRLGILSRDIGKGKPISVSLAGQDLPEFKYNVKLDPSSAEGARQDQVLLAVIRALAQVPAPYVAPTGANAPQPEPVDVELNLGDVHVKIASKDNDRTLISARNAALRYIEIMREGLETALPDEQVQMLMTRYRYALAAVVNPARKKQSLPALDPSPVLLAHPRLDLYVDVDSPHSFEAVGCTSCHDGSGQETDFVLAAHSPRDIFVDARTGVPVLNEQLANTPEKTRPSSDLSSMLGAVFPKDSIEHKQVAELHFEPTTQPSGESARHSDDESVRPVAYSDPATGKSGYAIPQFDYWKKTYEPNAPRDFELVYHEWDWPMRTPDYIQANCARCHTDVYDIKETAPLLYEGRQMFTQLGCVNCHQMDSIPANQNHKVGPDLRHVTAKLSPEFINTWIWAPKAFRPTTKMPHFFMLENNSSDEELRRTRQEARAITEYLVHTATPLPPKHVYPKDGHGSAEAGKAIFDSIGCLACHQNLNERGEKWITTDLEKRAGMKADQARKAYNAMSYNERQLYVQQYLAEPLGHNTKPVYPDGSPKPEFVQVGPELSGIGTKLTAGRTVEQARQWLFDWLMEPRHYSEYTIMPRLRLSSQQAMDLIEYLLDQKRTTTDPNDKWQAGLTPIDTQKLIQLTALQLKSRYSWNTAQTKADDDAELTADAIAALTTPVKSAEEAKVEVETMSKDEKRLVFLGQKLIANYGCMSCHAINGMENASNPGTNLSDWGQKSVDKLDFGYLDPHKVQELPPSSQVQLVNGLSPAATKLAHEPQITSASAPVRVGWPHVAHTRDAWITQKLKNTRIYDRGKALLDPAPGEVGSPYDKLKMPTFYLNDEQVHAIVTFVISNRDRLISQALTEKATNEQAKIIARGRELTERYNCVACHQIEKNQPEIHQYFQVTDVITKAPPSLRGEGNKIQYNWLFNFFKNVEQMRPLLFTGIRMPSFPANDDEFSAIIAYFNAISNKESQQLAKQIDPINKYIAAQVKLKGPATQPTDPQPGEDWWQQRQLAANAEYLKNWGLDFGHIKPIEVGPLASESDLNKVYKTLLFKASFTRELYQSPFPFVDSPRPEISDERFALGEQFFYQMQCLKCHVLGDPEIPGANKTPTAPNLSLAHRRLQRRWIRHWVQEPNIIQVGTAMPPFFTGLPIFKLDGQPWPKSQGITGNELKQVEEKYGKTPEEQTDLLLDFLYAAGVRGFTGVQPSATPSKGGATTQPSAHRSDSSPRADARGGSGFSPGLVHTGG